MTVMLKNKLTQAIQVWAKQGKKRQRVPLQYRDKHNIIINGSQYIDFSSNDCHIVFFLVV